MQTNPPMNDLKSLWQTVCKITNGNVRRQTDGRAKLIYLPQVEGGIQLFFPATPFEKH